MARSLPQTPRGVVGPTRSGAAALAADLAARLDSVALAVRVSITPDEWQAEVLRSPADRILLNCARQSGKSVTAALLAIHKAFYTPNSTTLLLSPGQRQSSELFKKVLAFYRRLGRPVSPLAENQMSLELQNGSRIVSMPGNESTVRGFTADLLVVDEASRVPDDFYTAVLPMLAVSGGRLLALSTPHGVSGWWAEAWHSEERWTRWEVPATCCPRISPETLEEQRLALGEWAFEQEYMCKFMDDEWSIFSAEAIAALANPSLEEIDI